MCTVSFITHGDAVHITSNRDEQSTRLPAYPPATYHTATGLTAFPKDADAGGTWIAMHECGRAVVLLNGGFINHRHTPPYRKSRGLILLDLIAADDPAGLFAEMDLPGIEPFTTVVWANEKLFECRWDGIGTHVSELDPSLPRIWSSATLYDASVMRKRESWFGEWIRRNPQPSGYDIIRFHQSAGDGDPNNDLLMDRGGRLSTVSITAIDIRRDAGSMSYHDIRSGAIHNLQLDFRKHTTQKG